MVGRIPREFIDDLLVRVDIVDLIDSHVPLKKTGSNFSARCPFHTEKSPSFSVNRKKQFFYCFGCGAGGNAITFLMDYSHLEFVEAIEDLAAFVGIDVPREQNSYTVQKPDNLKDLYGVLESAAKFYAQQLKSNSEAQKAIQYLKSRGLSGVIARDFMLGYAPDAWNELSKRFDNKLLLEAGLLIRKDNGRSYDRFRGRIMFPIRDKRSRVVGFGARVLDDSMPKYLNSPETPTFSKSKEVYGLYELTQKKAKPERILIVEGYMDVIALAQFGIHYAVATLGTATSKTHFDILFRFSNELVLCFDGDKAGKKAVWNAIETAMPTLRDGRQIRIMLMPQGHDPDSLVREIGTESFTANLSGAQTLSDYFFEHFITELDLKTVEGRASLVNQARPYLERLPEGIFREMMQTKLQQLSETPKLAFSENATKLSLNRTILKPNEKKHLSPARIAVALLIQNPHLSKLVSDEISNKEYFNFLGLDFFKNVLNTITKYHSINTGSLLEIYRGHSEEKILRKLASLEFLFPETGIEAEFLDAVSKLIQQAKEQQFETSELLNKQPEQQWSMEEKQQLIARLKQNN